MMQVTSSQVLCQGRPFDKACDTDAAVDGDHRVEALDVTRRANTAKYRASQLLYKVKGRRVNNEVASTFQVHLSLHACIAEADFVLCP